MANTARRHDAPEARDPSPTRPTTTKHIQAADHVLCDRMAAVVGFELERPALTVAAKGVVAVDGQEGELAAGGGLHRGTIRRSLGCFFEKDR
jgi:hypothetical protein